MLQQGRGVLQQGRGVCERRGMAWVDECCLRLRMHADEAAAAIGVRMCCTLLAPRLTPHCTCRLPLQPPPACTACAAFGVRGVARCYRRQGERRGGCVTAGVELNLDHAKLTTKVS